MTLTEELDCHWLLQSQKLDRIEHDEWNDVWLDLLTVLNVIIWITFICVVLDRILP